MGEQLHIHHLVVCRLQHQNHSNTRTDQLLMEHLLHLDMKANSLHKGTVKEMYDKGAIVQIDEIEAFCPKKHLIKEDDSRAKVGDNVQFKVIEFSKESKKILVSHTSVHMQIEHEEKQKTKKQISSNLKIIQKSQKQSTLGDLEELNKLKDEIK